jgi:hypothetical protein
MACHSCESGDGLRARYCDDCGRWTFHADPRHVLIAGAIMLAATVVVVVALIQPELVVPLMAGAGALVKRILTARV